MSKGCIYCKGRLHDRSEYVDGIGGWVPCEACEVAIAAAEERANTPENIARVQAAMAEVEKELAEAEAAGWPLSPRGGAE